MDATARKLNGVHYTPIGLAAFLARQTVDCLPSDRKRRPISILDPACGDGQLLAAMIAALNERGFEIARVVGWDTDASAVDVARRRIKPIGDFQVRIETNDFLDGGDSESGFDCVIANPPYVRTQNLGAGMARSLAERFQLTGRVDLYQVFAMAIASVLKPGGVVGLLTSNRFLSVRSGADMRRLLREEFELRQVFDLGDSRLFKAAVLPVVVTAVKRLSDSQSTSAARFHRVSCTNAESVSETHELLDVVAEHRRSGEIRTRTGTFLIERGELYSETDDSVWMLSNPNTRRWLSRVRDTQVHQFLDLAEIKVGIKTTADAVFIKRTWQTPADGGPESSLIQPLITHHDALRWKSETPQKQVLYPYDLSHQRRTAIELDRYPLAAGYLEQHRDRLESRKYLIASRRQWFEIWVPHQPAQWSQPKIVWPDISEQPRFFWDDSGAIVNGDCYWIKLRPGVDPDWLYLMLAVANSSIATTFYDTVFHNKLYAGRRRFMTQYVREFPLPELDSRLGEQIVACVKRLVESPKPSDETLVEALVQQAFGLA